MIVDTSALVAVIRSEPDGPIYFKAMIRAASEGETLTISAANLFELYLVIDKDRSEALTNRAEAVIAEIGLKVAPVTAELVAVARDANRRFGRGSGTRARLNFGDYFAYALTKQTGEPLLFKGEDFAQTDIVSAI